MEFFFFFDNNSIFVFLIVLEVDFIVYRNYYMGIYVGYGEIWYLN